MNFINCIPIFLSFFLMLVALQFLSTAICIRLQTDDSRRRTPAAPGTSHLGIQETREKGKRASRRDPLRHASCVAMPGKNEARGKTVREEAGKRFKTKGRPFDDRDEMYMKLLHRCQEKIYRFTLRLIDLLKGFSRGIRRLCAS
jgi:hypothetical protein